MDCLAPLVRRVIAPLWASWEGSGYLRHAKELANSQFQPAEMIRQRQWKSLQGLVQHAYQTCPFWRARMDDAGLTPAVLKTFDDFRRLPLLTKQDLRLHMAEMQSNDYSHAPLVVKKTSGSTGVSVQVMVDEAAHQFKRAATLRSDEWSGWRQGERIAVVWGAPDDLRTCWRGRLRNALLERLTYLDTLTMNVAAMRQFANEMRCRPASLLFGHAHSLYLLAEFYRKEEAARFRPKGIISTAMVLHDWQRRGIEEVFACPVTNRYGCEEVSLIACECEQHHGLHINAEGVYVEVLRQDGAPAAPGERGSIVITDLQNRAMPMLRYKVGDTATATDRVCKCGRGLPLLESLEGREADYVFTPQGRMVSGISLTDHFNTLVDGVAQMQIVQEELHRFVFRVVRCAGWGATSELQLRQLVAERFGPGIVYQTEFVDQIPQEPSGKYRFCISKVPNPFTVPVSLHT